MLYYGTIPCGANDAELNSIIPSLRANSLLTLWSWHVISFSLHVSYLRRKYTTDELLWSPMNSDAVDISMFALHRIPTCNSKLRVNITYVLFPLVCVYLLTMMPSYLDHFLVDLVITLLAFIRLKAWSTIATCTQPELPRMDSKSRVPLISHFSPDTSASQWIVQCVAHTASSKHEVVVTSCVRVRCYFIIVTHIVPLRKSASSRWCKQYKPYLCL